MGSGAHALRRRRTGVPARCDTRPGGAHLPGRLGAGGVMSATLTVPTTTNRLPRTLTIDVAGIPKDLHDLNRWGCWRWESVEDSDGNPKWMKVPINADTGTGADSTNPD